MPVSHTFEQISKSFLFSKEAQPDRDTVVDENSFTLILDPHYHQRCFLVAMLGFMSRGELELTDNSGQRRKTSLWCRRLCRIAHPVKCLRIGSQKLVLSSYSRVDFDRIKQHYVL